MCYPYFMPARNSPKEISGASGGFLPKPQYERIYWVLYLIDEAIFF